jgi:cytochrome b6-f complex iron-sulfur subunit
MPDEKDAPTPQEPASGSASGAAGATPTAPPDTAAAHPAGTAAGSTPPVPTPPMTSAAGDRDLQAAPAPRSNAASGVSDPAPPRPEGVATAEPTVPADAKPPATPPAPPRPMDPAVAAAAAPAAVNTKGPSDGARPGGPNPVAEDATATIAFTGAPTAAEIAAAKPAVSPTAPATRTTAPPAAPPTSAPAAKTAAAPPKAREAEGMSRRGFLKWTSVGWVAFSAACTSGLVASTRFLFPNVLFEPPQAFKAGFPSEYTVGEVDTRWKDGFGVWIVRNSDGFYALLATCTHLGCSPNWLAAENKFKCPCHGSGFYKDGVNFEGPAPRPLERARVVLADDGQILVDKSVKFQQEKGEWAADDAFLKL